MATTADIRNGLVIEYNDDLFSIVEFQHVKPGNGPRGKKKIPVPLQG